MNDLLTVGSIVKLDESSPAKIMIVGYNMKNKLDGKIYHYAGAMIPEGIPESNSFFLFNKSDIKEVLYEGYQTDESKQYAEYIEGCFEKNEL